MSQINIKSIGGLVKFDVTNLTPAGARRTIYRNRNSGNIEIELLNGFIQLNIGVTYTTVSLSDFLFDGVPAADFTEFETKLAEVFPSLTT